MTPPTASTGASGERTPFSRTNAPVSEQEKTLLCSHLPIDIGKDSKKAVQDWESEVSRYERLYVLRELMYDSLGLFPEPCAERAFAWKHKQSGEYQLRPSTCHDRCICPRCAIGYGLERGDELLEFFKTVLEAGQLLDRQPTVKAFAFVLTLPDWLSAHLDSVVGRCHRSDLRNCLGKLTKAAQRTLCAFFGADVGLKVNWHWWHSSDPLSGPHWHMHVLVPNIRFLADGSSTIVQAMGKVSDDSLDALKVSWAKHVSRLGFVKKLRKQVPDALTVNYRFLTKWKGKYSLAHRCRYDARHPMQDVESWVGVHEDKNGLPDLDSPWLKWFLHRLSVLQGVQLARSLGWCSNAKAKQIGLEKYRPDDAWERVPGVVYRFMKFDIHGAIVQATDTLTGKHHREAWDRTEINLAPRGSPCRYRFRTSGAGGLVA